MSMKWANGMKTFVTTELLLKMYERSSMFFPHSILELLDSTSIIHTVEEKSWNVDMWIRCINQFAVCKVLILVEPTVTESWQCP